MRSSSGRRAALQAYIHAQTVLKVRTAMNERTATAGARRRQRRAYRMAPSEAMALKEPAAEGGGLVVKPKRGAALVLWYNQPRRGGRDRRVRAPFTPAAASWPARSGARIIGSAGRGRLRRSGSRSSRRRRRTAARSAARRRRSSMREVRGLKQKVRALEDKTQERARWPCA